MSSSRPSERIRKPRFRRKLPRSQRIRGELFRPKWLKHFERSLGETLSVNPVVLSAIKGLIVTPLIIMALAPLAWLPNSRPLVSALFVAFVILDYLEAVLARGRGLEPRSARVFDRLTDYPLLFALAYFASSVVPFAILATKLALDVLLLVLYMLGRGSTENRLRTGISYAALIAILFAGQGWGERVFTTGVVEAILWANIAFSATTAAYYLGFLQKRFVADVLSAANLLCGGFSIFFASRGRFEVSLLFVILGAAFDGFDGAAARRWGGTRFGVYSDDVADGVNYGLAPAVALYFALGGLSGWLVGTFYATFTIARLVFFTLNKAASDPNYFAGVPSPVGGLVTMSAIVVFPDEPGALGLIVGIACAQMVSFSTHYHHIGRALARHRRALVGAPAYLLVLLLGLRLWGPQGAGAIILIGNLIYGFVPTAVAFGGVFASRKSSPAEGLATGHVDETVPTVSASPPPKSPAIDPEPLENAPG